jgi:hypothetical protein
VASRTAANIAAAVAATASRRTHGGESDITMTTTDAAIATRGPKTGGNYDLETPN